MKNQIPPPGVSHEDFWQAVKLVDFSLTINEKYKSTGSENVQASHREATKNGVYEPYIDKVLNITTKKLFDLLEEIHKQRKNSWKTKRKLFEENYNFKSISSDNFFFADGEWSTLA